MIEITSTGLQEAANALKQMPGKADKAARKAVQTATKGLKKEAAEKVLNRYTIKRGKVSKTMRLRRRGMSAELSSRGPVNDLSYFKHNPRSVPKRRPAKGKYLYSEVVKGQGGTIAHAFLARMGSGHVGIMHRTNGNASLPIAKYSGPSTPQMLGSPTVRTYIEKALEERFTKAMEAEAENMLGGG